MENFFLEAREIFFLLSHVALASYNGSLSGGRLMMISTRLRIACHFR